MEFLYPSDVAHNNECASYGYYLIGPNALPDIASALSSIDEDQVRHRCQELRSHKLWGVNFEDDADFLWTTFEGVRGLVTNAAEAKCGLLTWVD